MNRPPSRSPNVTPRNITTNATQLSRMNSGGYGVSLMTTNVPSPSHSVSSNGSARSSPRHGSVPRSRLGSSAIGGGSASSAAMLQQQQQYLQQRNPVAYAAYNAPRGDDETASNVSETLSIGTGNGGLGGPFGTLASPSNSIASRGGSYCERGSNFKVVIRVRPPLPRELHSDRPFQNVISVDAPGHVLTVSENLSALHNDDSSGSNSASGATPGAYGSHVFSFDHVYDQQCTQRAVYENTAKAVVESSLEGYNATIFAYGQTGTGKTYTMEGFNSGSGSVEERGIIPRAIEQIFQHIQSNVSARMRFLVRASYLQIYNESISDLLKPERNNLMIREDKKRGVFVEGLSEWVVRSPEEIYGLMERGGAMRATGSTKMNEISSRSHAVFIIIAEQSKTSYVDAKGNDISPEEFTTIVNAYQSRNGAGGNGNDKRKGGNAAAPNGGNGSGLHPKLESMVRQSFKVGKLNLVDLAGSERVRLSGATGQRLEESKKINQSLSALGNVISALTDARGRQHIPYRDSKLTRILEDSLGGNCKTTMMAMISPALEAMTESLSTLKFANRAKNIKNEARVNEDLDQKSLLRKYERELKRLRAELDEKSRNVVDKRRLLELDEQRRRAEEDKMAAIRALEERSREFMKEKEEKKKLEQRISMLASQVLMSNQRKGSGSQNENGGDQSNQFGGAVGEFDGEDPIFRDAIKEHQDRIRKEYECRLADLEKERETIEEEKAQVDRYKQLLLKQRDIMIALTQRLNERDEQITALQDELDAYDRHQKELEEKLDEKTAHLIHLQRVTMEQTANSPGKPNSELMKALGDWAGAPSSAATASLASSSSSSVFSSATAPELLITTKQFRPYAACSDHQIIYNNNNSSHSSASGIGSAAGSDLLSADEKIQELKTLLDAQSTEQTRMAKELEDVKSEKVSIEYLLRERMEKLVQVEMDARMKSMNPVGSPAAGLLQHQMTRMKEQMTMLEMENRQLKESTTQPPGASDDEQARQLQGRCDTLVKERRAVQTIMEQKIKALVNAISDASEETVRTAGGAEHLGEPARWLKREVTALQRLVNASIVALRNAESGSSSANKAAVRSEANADASGSSAELSRPPTLTSSAPVPSTASSSMSVDELIQQRREQLQRERHMTG